MNRRIRIAQDNQVHYWTPPRRQPRWFRWLALGLPVGAVGVAVIKYYAR